MGGILSNDAKMKFPDIKSLKDMPDEYFVPGRKVHLIANEKYVKFVQEDSFGWINSMSRYLGHEYTVKSVQHDKAIILDGIKNDMRFHRAALEAVDEECAKYAVGDIVRLSADEEKFTRLQKTVGGYSKCFMQPLLGKSVQIMHVLPSCLQVNYNGQDFDLHPLLIDEKVLDKKGRSVSEPIKYKVGDFVRLSSDEESFKKLQYEVGGFSERKMQSLIGQRVRIMHISSSCIEIDWQNEPYSIHQHLIILDANTCENDKSSESLPTNLEENSIIDPLENPSSREDANTSGNAKSSEALQTDLEEDSLIEPLENPASREEELELLFQSIKEGDLANMLKYIKTELLNTKNYLGRTPINNACCYGHLELVIQLLDFNADLNIADQYGYCPIHNCITFNQPHVLNYLLQNVEKAIETLTKDGKTLLHVAVIKERNEIEQSLLAAEINIHILDDDGKTAAEYTKNPELVNENISTLDPSSRINNDKIECEICWERPKNVAFIPCGHTSCDSCVKKLVVCHICKVIIRSNLPLH